MTAAVAGSVTASAVRVRYTLAATRGPLVAADSLMMLINWASRALYSACSPGNEIPLMLTGCVTAPSRFPVELQALIRMIRPSAFARWVAGSQQVDCMKKLKRRDTDFAIMLKV